MIENRCASINHIIPQTFHKEILPLFADFLEDNLFRDLLAAGGTAVEVLELFLLLASMPVITGVVKL